MDNLNLILSVSAIIISFIGFLFSYFSFKQQITRERREELRSIVEKLIRVREEFGQIMKIDNEVEKESRNSTLNEIRGIYLESAEYIASRIGHHATSAELIVIGFENEMDADFNQAKRYYELSTKLSKKSSPNNQAQAYKYLGGIYFSFPPYRDFKKGRDAFSRAIKAVRSSDPYSLYTNAFTSRIWSSKELFWNNFIEAEETIRTGLSYLEKMPLDFTLKISEQKFYAQHFYWISDKYLKSNIKEHQINPVKLFEDAQELIDEFDDHFTLKLQGLIIYQLAMINVAKEDEISKSSLTKAKQCFDRLPEEFKKDKEILQCISHINKLIG